MNDQPFEDPAPYIKPLPAGWVRRLLARPDFDRNARPMASLGDPENVSDAVAEQIGDRFDPGD